MGKKVLTRDEARALLQQPPEMKVSRSGSYPQNRERIVCADGTSLSIQASHLHYCTPRTNDGGYTHLELGYPTAGKGTFHYEPLSPYQESEGLQGESVFPCVPIEILLDLIDSCGGIVVST